MAKAKPVVKAAALDKTINASIEALNKACDAASAAVTKKAEEDKKLAGEVKRGLKKKSALAKRSKTVAAKYKKSPDAASKKAVGVVTKDVKATSATLDKSRANKATVAAELTSLKSASKKLTAYTKAIASADKVLNKPAKKRRKAKKK